MDTKTNALSRRDFLKMAAAAGLGLTALASKPALAGGMSGGGGTMGGGGGGMGGGGGGMGGGGMGGGVIDPPAGAAFKEPLEIANTSTDPAVFQCSLEAKFAPVNINGTNATLYTYNGSYPGPAIRLKPGHQHLKIDYHNGLPLTANKNILGFTRNHSNLHTHGLHVSPKEPADAAHLDIGPGMDYHYDYDLSCAAGGSLHILHCHSHGLVAEQYWGGLLSPIIVEDPPEITALAGFETHTLILKDITVSGGAPEPHSSTMDFMHGKEGNTIMVNGLVNPVLSARPGQVQRWRVLNGSNGRYYKLSLQGHTLQVVGTDGGLLDKPYPQSSMLLAPGERLDILVKASATKGNYKLLSLPYIRMGNMSSAQITLLTLAVQGSPASGSIPTVVNSSAKRLSMNTSSLPQRTLALSMMMGRGYINGMDFDVEPYTQMSDLGAYEVWRLVNNTNMDHPFHQHVNAAQVLSITGGDAGYSALYTRAPAWKDVVNIPRGGEVKILVPVMDWEGMTMFHCHIVEHEDIGMMGLWMIGGMM